MPTWVRVGTGTAPSNTDANLVGDYALDNGTIPSDWGGTINSVRVQWSVVGTSFNDDDSWDDELVDLMTGAVEISAHPGGGSTGNKNTTVNNDNTDSSISQALSDAQWEAAVVRGSGAASPTEWALYVKIKGPDGGVLTAASVTVTIDYEAAGGLAIVKVEGEAVNVAEGDLHTLDLVRLDGRTVQVAEGDLKILYLVRQEDESVWIKPLRDITADDFIGADDDPWNSSIWDVTSGSGTPVTDIQSNRGRMAVEVGDKAQAVTDNSVTPDVDVIARIIRTATGNNFTLSVGDGTWTGDGEQSGTGYVFNDSGAVWRIFTYIGGSFGSQIGSWTRNEELDVMVRIQRIGTTIRARTWAPGTEEPSTWDFDITDTAITISTWFVHFAAFETASLDVDWDDMEFGLPAEDLHIIGSVIVEGETVNISEADLKFIGVIRVEDEIVQVSEGELTILELLRQEDESIQISELAIPVVGLLRQDDGTVQIAEGVLKFVVQPDGSILIYFAEMIG